jgi:hypothetical protein
VTHRWRDAGGEFSGVIVGMLEPQFFDKAWTFDSEIEGLAIALTAADGSLIMRRPFVADMMGRRLAGDSAAAQAALGGSGDTVQFRDLQGAERLAAYRRVAAYPNLLIFVSQPMDVVLGGWRRIAWIGGSSWLVALLALVGLGAWLAREMKARGVLENRYRALFDSVPYPVIVSDPDSRRVLAVNRAAGPQYRFLADSGAAPASCRKTLRSWPPGGRTSRRTPRASFAISVITTGTARRSTSSWACVSSTTTDGLPC